MVLLPLQVSAQEPTPVKCTVPIAVTSPCSGVLLPTDAAADGLRCLKIDVPRLKLELSFHKELWESREKRLTSLLLAEQTRGDKLFQLHQEALVVAKPAWYEHPAFWFAVGFVVATGTTVGITYAVNTPD